MVAQQHTPNSLTSRLLSVAILIPLLVAAGWWPWATTLTVAICIALGIRELFAIMSHGGFTPRIGPGIVVGLAFAVAAALRPFTSLDLTSFVLALSIGLTLCYELLIRDRTASLQSWALTLSGAIYIGWLLSSFILLRQINLPLRPSPLTPLAVPPGTAWLFLVFATTWIQDSAAYFVGRTFGRHRMAPILSPKKTWEGFAGGMFASVATTLVATALLGLPISYLGAGMLGVAAGIAGPLGDLGESLIKRQVGVKDSGHLIPGHGGILDRMDSLLFVGPVIYYSVLYRVL